MKQTVLLGQTSGLRPAQQRRLERLSHRRQPETTTADLLTLQRLAAESQELALPLTLVIDGRGLIRLLWVGPLAASGRLVERLPGSQRRLGQQFRLITCIGGARLLPPGGSEAIVGLDVSPRCWLRYRATAEKGGHWPAALFAPAGDAASPWRECEQGDLSDLCEALIPDEATSESLGDSPNERPAAAGIAPEGEHHHGRQRRAPARERVLLLALTPADRTAAERELDELKGLVRSAGAEPVGVMEQRRQGQTTPTLWGAGKLQEAAIEARRLRATLVVTDRELSPTQGRTLESLLDLPVTDRSELILDIFAQRAASAAGRLQVELAQLRYRLPRLSGRGLSLSRQGGGIGTRGPGETQLEKDRRAIARRIERLHREVQRLGDHRARLRQGRQSLPRLALVGYTNAGKSSLMNSLTKAGPEAGVLAENKLFATLDPTTRRLELPDPQGGPPGSVLLTDTVGFIRDLPPPLVEAFRSTLEETLEADQLLLVVDLSDPAWPEHWQTVNRILDELGSRTPRCLVANQIDRCDARELERARALEAGALFVSATAGLGLSRLRQWLWEHLNMA